MENNILCFVMEQPINMNIIKLMHSKINTHYVAFWHHFTFEYDAEIYFEEWDSPYIVH